MPVIRSDGIDIDYLDVGAGPVVLLVHSAASNNRQWKQLIENHQHQFRFLAVNLFGYGDTSAWTEDVTQTLADQVGLLEALSTLVDDSINIVGHSFGGSVAAAAAHTLNDRVRKLVLLEANPFPLLAREGQEEAHNEVRELWKFLEQHGSSGDWGKVAERFVTYWLGEDAWPAMSPERQEAFISALPNNRYEWDSIMNMDVSEAFWQGIKADTLAIRASQTKKSIIGIYEVLQSLCPHWTYMELSEGGHMAPMARPDIVNPLITEFLGRSPQDTYQGV